MIYEFITPSDPITFKAESDKVAFFCALALGKGKAGMKRQDGAECESPMVFLQSDPMPDIEAYLESTIAEFGDKNAADVAACFDSFAYGSFSSRAAHDAKVESFTTPEKLAEYLTEHENTRSSMSQWVRSAWRYAESFDKKAKELLQV